MELQPCSTMPAADLATLAFVPETPTQWAVREAESDSDDEDGSCGACTVLDCQLLALEADGGEAGGEACSGPAAWSAPPPTQAGAWLDDLQARGTIFQYCIARGGQ